LEWFVVIVLARSWSYLSREVRRVQPVDLA